MTNQYLDQDSKSKIRFRRFFLSLLLLTLAVAVAVGFFLSSQQKKKADTIEAYVQAVENEEYDQAMALYRQVKERALSNDTPERQKEQYRQTMKLIEEDIDRKLDELFDALLNGQTINEDQLDFAEGMAEIAGVRLIGFVRQQCQQYLFGEMAVNQLRMRIDPLLDLTNVRPVLSDIPDQLPAMNLAVPFFSAAEQMLQNEQWYEALAAWNAILERTEFGSFVLDFAYERKDLTQKRMYEPLIAQVEKTMKGGRYVTAYDQLQRLAEVFPEDATIQNYTSESARFVPEKMVLWGEYNLVEIITIRPLIIDEKTAFDGDQYETAANDAMLTEQEFRRMLDELYKNDYVLIDAFHLYTEEGRLQEFWVPEGKKPLVLVLDSLNYYVTRRETGNAWNLVLDSNGSVSTLYKLNGESVIRRDAEAIGILDEFVEAHPEFSFDGAKGVISLTGYECIFGYVVSEDQAKLRNEALAEHGYPREDFNKTEIELQRTQAMEIADQLRQTGWLFASSTYGNINLRDTTYETAAQDVRLWQDQVGAVVGQADMLNYPQGAFLNGSDERLQYLVESGFRFFAGQGATPYRIQGANYLYADKLPVNGFVLRQPGSYQLDRLFDAAVVYDPTNRP